MRSSSIIQPSDDSSATSSFPQQSLETTNNHQGRRTTQDPPHHHHAGAVEEEANIMIKFKWRSAFCMCLPSFGNKAKGVKKEEVAPRIEEHYSVSHVMSSTFSFEPYDHNNNNNKGNNEDDEEENYNHENQGDESISSYFELPSQVLKTTGASVE
ncbi:hypothetical protein S245_047967 [Arachis hypogaea]|nr:uncharacterized protein DS421_14g459010 [Arachis hypogaea]